MYFKVVFLYVIKEPWEVWELVAYSPLIRHGPHRKRRVQQFFYCCVPVRCRGNNFNEPLPSNDIEMHVQTY
jgi:hypothetical protein